MPTMISKALVTKYKETSKKKPSGVFMQRLQREKDIKMNISFTGEKTQKITRNIERTMTPAEDEKILNQMMKIKTKDVINVGKDSGFDVLFLKNNTQIITKEDAISKTSRKNLNVFLKDVKETTGKTETWTLWTKNAGTEALKEKVKTVNKHLLGLIENFKIARIIK